MFHKVASRQNLSKYNIWPNVSDTETIIFMDLGLCIGVLSGNMFDLGLSKWKL